MGLGTIKIAGGVPGQVEALQGKSPQEAPLTIAPQFLTRQRALDFIDAFPGKDPRELLGFLAAAGHTVEGFNGGLDSRALTKFPSDLVSYLGGVLEGITNIRQTAKGLDQLAGSIMAKIVNSVQRSLGGEPEARFKDAEELFDANVAVLAASGGLLTDEKTGKLRFSADLLTYSINTKPAQTLGDIATFVTPVTSAAGGALQATGKAAGLVRKGSRVAAQLNSIGKKVRRMGQLLEPVEFTRDAIVKVLSPAARRSFALVNKGFGWDDFWKRRARSQKTKAAGLSAKAQQDLIALLDKPMGDVLAEFGITGGINDSARQLGEISAKSVAAVDARLAAVETKLRGRAFTQGRSIVAAEDLLDGMNKVLRGMKNETAKKLRLSNGLFLRKIRGAEIGGTKILPEGLTVTEMNQIKRTFDREFPKAFTKTGVPAQAARLGDMAKIRLSLQTGIEKIAGSQGVKDLRRINKQAQRAFVARNIFEGMKNIVNTRSPVSDRILVTGGAVGTIVYGNPALLAGAGVFVAAESLVKSTHFRNAFANNLYLLSEVDFKALEGGIDFNRGTVSSRAKKLLNRAAVQARKFALSPEVRLGLRAGEKGLTESDLQLLDDIRQQMKLKKAGEPE